MVSPIFTDLSLKDWGIEAPGCFNSNQDVLTREDNKPVVLERKQLLTSLTREIKKSTNLQTIFSFRVSRMKNTRAQFHIFWKEKDNVNFEPLKADFRFNSTRSAKNFAQELFEQLQNCSYLKCTRKSIQYGDGYKRHRVFFKISHSMV